MKVKLSNHNSKTLMLALHQKIEDYAESISEKLAVGETDDLLVYPPNNDFTKNEKQALEKLKNDQNLKSALKKILADNSGGVIFELMNLIDGTTDPEESLGKWSEVSIIDKSDKIEESDEMLHDDFFSTYWDWKSLKNGN